MRRHQRRDEYSFHHMGHWKSPCYQWNWEIQFKDWPLAWIYSEQGVQFLFFVEETALGTAPKCALAVRRATAATGKHHGRFPARWGTTELIHRHHDFRNDTFSVWSRRAHWLAPDSTYITPLVSLFGSLWRNLCSTTSGLCWPEEEVCLSFRAITSEMCNHTLEVWAFLYELFRVRSRCYVKA
jgi:hypothetical protein